MAIMKPKKQRTDRIESTGGGVRGLGRGAGKSAPAPKVKLKPEPSSVTIKPGKYNLNPDSAAKANAKIKAERARTTSAKNQKSALKAANKPAKYKSADAARQKAFDRAKEALAKNKAGIGPKLTPAQKYAYRQSLSDFNMTQKGKRGVK